MFKKFLMMSTLVFSLNMTSCNRQPAQPQYVPGLGEIMTLTQMRHAKLWFAGQNENWGLAEFEVNEIKENLENIKKYQSERKEAQMVIMINPAIDSVSLAIQQKDPVLFKTTFTSLTNRCNSCHKLVNYSFNQVKVPDTPPFSNQDFSIKK